MPEFILDHGSADGAKTFRTLTEFQQGYVEAMFFTADEELVDATFEELSEEALAKVRGDCARFITAARDLLDKAYSDTYDEAQAGRDFWFTRNGHGVGFWDRDLPGDLGEALSKAAHAWGECSLYRGDDEKLYLE